MDEFKPTRREVIRVRRLASSVETHARNALRFALAEVPSLEARSLEFAESGSKVAFALSQHVAERSRS